MGAKAESWTNIQSMPNDSFHVKRPPHTYVPWRHVTAIQLNARRRGRINVRGLNLEIARGLGVIAHLIPAQIVHYKEQHIGQHWRCSLRGRVGCCCDHAHCDNKQSQYEHLQPPAAAAANAVAPGRCTHQSVCVRLENLEKHGVSSSSWLVHRHAPIAAQPLRRLFGGRGCESLFTQIVSRTTDGYISLPSCLNTRIFAVHHHRAHKSHHHHGATAGLSATSFQCESMDSVVVVIVVLAISQA
jgi:hypothetical protein